MPSPIILNGTCFRFRMMSVASSTTPGIGLNSCETPSMRTPVMAAPSMELKQHAAQAGADGGSESTLERLSGKLAETLGERLGIGN